MSAFYFTEGLNFLGDLEKTLMYFTMCKNMNHCIRKFRGLKQVENLICELFLTTIHPIN